MRRAPQFSTLWRWVLAVFVFTGCVAPKVVEYKSFHNRTFSARSKAAELQQKSTSELLAGGYLLIGYIDLRRNIQTCYVDNRCVRHSTTPPARSELLQEAAHRGGDVVTLLDERTVLEPNNRSDCTGFYTYTTMVNNKPMVHTSCLSYKTTPGKLEAKISRALIWRHDPDAAVSDANAKAIEQALQTLESVASKGDAPATNPVNSLIDTLTGGTEKKRNAAAEAASDLERRIYSAIRLNDRETLGALTRAGTLKTWSDEEGRSVLMIALTGDRLDAARTLAGLDPELGRSDKVGRTALHYGVMYGDRALVEQLVKAGHDPKIKIKSGAIMQFFAIGNPDTEVFDYLLSLGLDVQERDTHNDTALMVAAYFGRTGLMTRLLKMGFAIEHHDNEGETPLMSAVRGGQLEATQLLLKSGAKLAAIDNDKRTALHYAAHGGNVEVLRLLLERGAVINGEDKNGRTPLIDAIAGEKWSAVDFLLNRGATLTTTKFDARAVGTELLEKNQPQILRRYVAAYPMLKEQLVSNPEWLHFAAKKSGEASIKYLLDLGADVNQPSKTSVSPLMTAVNAGNVDAVKALLANKANSALRDARGRTALQVAIQSGSTKVVAAMRELGVRE